MSFLRMITPPIITTIVDRLRQMDGKDLDNAMLALSRRGYQVQSQYFHIPDYLGFFSQASSFGQLLEASYLCGLVVASVLAFLNVELPLFVFIRIFRPEVDFYRLAMNILRAHIGCYILCWVIVVVVRCFNKEKVD